MGQMDYTYAENIIKKGMKQTWFIWKQSPSCGTEAWYAD